MAKNHKVDIDFFTGSVEKLLASGPMISGVRKTLTMKIGVQEGSMSEYIVSAPTLTNDYISGSLYDAVMFYNTL